MLFTCYDLVLQCLEQTLLIPHSDVFWEAQITAPQSFSAQHVNWAELAPKMRPNCHLWERKKYISLTQVENLGKIESNPKLHGLWWSKPFYSIRWIPRDLLSQGPAFHFCFVCFLCFTWYPLFMFSLINTPAGFYLGNPGGSITPQEKLLSSLRSPLSEFPIYLSSTSSVGVNKFLFCLYP